MKAAKERSFSWARLEPLVAALLAAAGVLACGGEDPARLRSAAGVGGSNAGAGAMSGASGAGAGSGGSAGASSGGSAGAAGDASSGSGGTAGTGGTAGVGGSAGNAGGPGDFGCEAMASSLEGASDDPGVDVTIGDGVVEFREMVMAWNVRPPMLEIHANSVEDEWKWFRLLVFPKGDDPSPTPGEYRCGLDQVYVGIERPDGRFETLGSGSGCTVVVSEASLETGSRFTGTLCARLVTADGAETLTLTAGSFFGVVQGF